MHHELNDYALTHLDDIQAALFELGHADCRITIRNAAGQEVAVEILALDSASRRFYWRPRHHAGTEFGNANMLTHSQLRFQAHGYSGVQINFCIDKPQITRADDGSTALISPFPEQLKRIQRRSAFRVQVANTSMLSTALWQPDPSSEPVKFQVCDLSADGIGMRTYQPLATLPALHSCMRHVVLKFDKHGDMVVDLIVHNCYPLGSQATSQGPTDAAAKTDITLAHVGGRFSGLDVQQTSRLQKIVWTIEKLRMGAEDEERGATQLRHPALSYRRSA